MTTQLFPLVRMAGLEQQIALIAGLRAAGHTEEEITAELGLPRWRLWYLRHKYAGLWKAAFESALKARASSAKSGPADSYTIRAESRLATWSQQNANGSSLPRKIRLSKNMTIPEFFRAWYAPVRLGQASPATFAEFEIAFRRWRAINGDPTLKQIDPPMLARFRDTLANLPGRKANQLLSPQTVRNYLRIIQCVLDKAGPAGSKNRDAAGLLDKVPWIKPPRPSLSIPRIVSAELVGRTYRAAAAMLDPQVPGVLPRDWWQALIALCWNTGLRRGSLFALRLEWVDWQRSQIRIPPSAMKGRRGEVVHLNTVALEHLIRIRGERPVLFPWPWQNRHFDRYWHQLQDLAGIPKADHFGLHTIRKTAATALYETSPSAAQLALGHLKLSTTERYYVSAPEIVARALDRLPQPREFAGDETLRITG